MEVAVSMTTRFAGTMSIFLQISAGKFFIEFIKRTRSIRCPSIPTVHVCESLAQDQQERLLAGVLLQRLPCIHT